MSIKKIVYTGLMAVARWMGSDIIDHRTGKKVARALLICARGRVYVLGLESDDQIIPFFLPQQRMTFWKREIGFTVHPAPDFSSEPRF